MAAPLFDALQADPRPTDRLARATSNHDMVHRVGEPRIAAYDTGLVRDDDVTRIADGDIEGVLLVRARNEEMAVAMVARQERVAAGDGEKAEVADAPPAARSPRRPRASSKSSPRRRS